MAVKPYPGGDAWLVLTELRHVWLLTRVSGHLAGIGNAGWLFGCLATRHCFRRRFLFTETVINERVLREKRKKEIGLVSHLWTYSCLSTSLCCEQVSYIDKQLVKTNNLAVLPTFPVRLCHPKLCEFWKRTNSVSPLLTWVHKIQKINSHLIFEEIN
jgi:hypothetical protein